MDVERGAPGSTGFTLIISIFPARALQHAPSIYLSLKQVYSELRGAPPFSRFSREGGDFDFSKPVHLLSSRWRYRTAVHVLQTIVSKPKNRSSMPRVYNVQSLSRNS